MEKDESKKKQELTDGSIFQKSNVLVTAMYQISLFENKIFSLAVQHSEIGYDPIGRTQRPIAVVYAKELGNYDTNSGTFYRKMKSAAMNLGKLHIMIEDEEKKSFEYVNLIGTTDYADGKITIYFEPRIARDSIMKPLKNFTLLSQQMLQRFKSVYSWKLYENLKSQCYPTNQSIKREDGRYIVEYSIGMLKLLLGLVDPGDETIQKILKADSKDFSIAMREIDEEDAGKPKKKRRSLYNTYAALSRSVIIPSVAEINEISDISVDFQPDRKGRGGRVTNLKFYVLPKVPAMQDVKAPDNLTEEEKVAALNALDDFMTVACTVKQKRQIMEAAGYNLDIVREKWTLTERKADIRDKIAFLIAAIKNDYKDDSIIDIDDELTDVSEPGLVLSHEEQVKMLFDRLWSEYPKKRNKSGVSAKAREEIFEKGYDAVHNAMLNYINEVQYKQKTVFPELEFVNGGEFFQNRYKEYLNTSQPVEKAKNSHRKKTTNEPESRGPGRNYPLYSNLEELERVQYGFEQNPPAGWVKELCEILRVQGEIITPDDEKDAEIHFGDGGLD